MSLKKNFDAVRKSVEDEPRILIQRCSLQLNIPKATVWQVLHKDLSLKSYKIQLTQELKPNHEYPIEKREYVNFIVVVM